MAIPSSAKDQPFTAEDAWVYPFDPIPGAVKTPDVPAGQVTLVVERDYDDTQVWAVFGGDYQVEEAAAYINATGNEMLRMEVHQETLWEPGEVIPWLCWPAAPDAPHCEAEQPKAWDRDGFPSDLVMHLHPTGTTAYVELWAKDQHEAQAMAAKAFAEADHEG